MEKNIIGYMTKKMTCKEDSTSLGSLFFQSKLLIFPDIWMMIVLIDANSKELRLHFEIEKVDMYVCLNLMTPSVIILGAFYELYSEVATLQYHTFSLSSNKVFKYLVMF